VRWRSWVSRLLVFYELRKSRAKARAVASLFLDYLCLS
jgi:hypothetical protein